MYKQIKIYNFFGWVKQLKKAGEELSEILSAWLDFILNPCKDTLEHLFEEVYDFLNVLEGIALVRFGISINDSKRTKEPKLNRTVDLMKDCKTVEEYETKRKMIK